MNIDMDLASGIAAFEAKEFRRAMQLLTPLADQGNPDAQFRLAVMYQNGLGNARNEAFAFHWMNEAAKGGFGIAEHGLGFMYLEGECVEKDEARAVEWFRKAAGRGLIGSMTTLAMMYEEGKGVEKDLEQARRWYQEAGFDDLPKKVC